MERRTAPIADELSYLPNEAVKVHNIHQHITSYVRVMPIPNAMPKTIAHDFRRASLKWLQRFFILLFVTLAVWYLFDEAR